MFGVTVVKSKLISIGFSQNSEWTYLFDGSSMDGWHQYNSDKMSSAWSIEDGELVLDSNDDNLSRGNDIAVSYTHLTLPTKRIV